MMTATRRGVALRLLGRAWRAPVAAVVVAAAAVAGPWSPAALSRGDALLARGDHEGAVVVYERVAAWGVLPQQRETALYRASVLYAVDLDDPVSSRRALRRLSRIARHPGARARAWEGLARLREAAAETPADLITAARGYRRAATEAPADPRAPARARRAARMYAEADRVGEAARTWSELSELRPEIAAEAALAIGRLHLARDSAEAALVAFLDAERLAMDDALRAEASAGVAVCEERLGELDGALADLGDLGNLDEEVP